MLNILPETFKFFPFLFLFIIENLRSLLNMFVAIKDTYNKAKQQITNWKNVFIIQLNDK
jgi:hypothetical protein